MKIDPKKGDLRIGGPEKIDADIPKRYYLNYEVTASDGEHETPLTVI